MPTVVYKKSELKKLIGKKISDEQLSEAITLIKPNLDSFDERTVTIEHTADRPDLFGAEGLARSVSNYLGLRKGLTKYSVGKPRIELKMEKVSVRPYVSAAVIRKVSMGDGFFDSMINLQELLGESIGRKRMKVAIGIHDFDKIKGNISYAAAAKSEKMTPLDSSEKMTLEEILGKTEKGKLYGSIIGDSRLWPVFKDSSGIFSFPPIINSDRTKVTDKTRNLFVEITGTDKTAVNQTMSVLASNFAETSSVEGVKLKHEKKSETTPNLSESVVEIDTKTVNEILGLSLPAKEIIELLKRMGYDTVGSAERLEVVVPPFRADILHPVDIVEDVAIAHGYNNFRPEIPNIPTTGSILEVEKICKIASMSMVGFGFQEVLASVLSNTRDQFDKMGLPKTDLVEIENPSSSEYTCVRRSLLPGLLKVLSANKHREYPQNVFEVGDVVLPDKVEETLARNERRIAAAICHSKSGFAEMKLVVDGVIKSLGRGYSVRPRSEGVFIPGRGVDIFVEKKFAGSFGEIHPQVVQNWDIGMPVAAAEISLENFS